MNYVFPCTITDVFERLLKKHVSGLGADSVFSTASDGWYIQLDHRVSLRIGDEKPEWAAGDKLELILRKP